MNIKFKPLVEEDISVLTPIMKKAFDDRYRKCFEKDWIDFDNFFFDNLDIADKYGFITVLDGEPIGHISWDPRNCPEYVEVGHNCIASKYKGNGYGKRQLTEALNRIKQYDGLKKIIVGTNDNVIAPKNYESCGFKLAQRRSNNTASDFSGDYLDYEIILL